MMRAIVFRFILPVIIRNKWILRRLFIQNSTRFASIKNTVDGSPLLSPNDALRALQCLCSSNTAQAMKMQEAISIVNRTDTDNGDVITVINAFLNFILNEGAYDEIFPIWRHIDQLLASQPRKSNISYPVLIKLCILSKSVDIHMLTNVLQRMKRDQYRLRIKDSFITKLIAKCNSSNDVHQIHSLISDGYLQTTNRDDVVIKTALINGYGKYSDINAALRTFHQITHKNTISINCLMTALLKNHDHEQTLKMHDEYHSLCDIVSHMLAIKACSYSNRSQKGREIHRNIQSTLEINTKEVMQCKHSLIHFYGHCCYDVNAALNLFHSIPDETKNSVSLKTMVQCLIKNEENIKAIEKALKHRHLMDESVQILVLNACVASNDHESGLQICGRNKSLNHNRNQLSNHRDSKMINSSNPSNSQSAHLQHTLIRFHFHFGDIPSAEEIFDSIPKQQRSVISTNLMMTGFIQNQQFQKAIDFYDEYHDSIDLVSHKLALKACAGTNDLQKGQDIHRVVLQNGNGSDIEIQNTLIKLYGDCGALEEARNVFQSIDLGSRTVVSINAMMTALVHNNAAEEALDLYSKCSQYRHMRDEVSDLLAIKACRILEDFERGKVLHSKMNSVESVSLKCALIDFYGYFGDIGICHDLYDSIPLAMRDCSVVGAMMKVLSTNMRDGEALELYGALGTSNHVLDLLAVKAAGNVGDFQRGKRIHRKYMNVDGEQILAEHVELRNALIEFCGKCGDIEGAKQLFEINRSDVIGIASMMNALLQNDRLDDALAIYEDANLWNNDTINILALKGCSSMNSMEKGERICEDIRKSTDCNPQMICSMIEFYGNCGDVKAAINVFNDIFADMKCPVHLHTLLKVLVENGYFEETLQIHKQEIGIADSRCHAMAIKACIRMDDGHQRGMTIYDQAVQNDSIDLGLKHAMIHFHGKFNCLEKAEEILISIKESERDAVTVGTMMTIYTNHRHHEEALHFYHDNGSIVNDTCHMMAIKTCVSLNDYEIGTKIIEKIGILEGKKNPSEDTIQLKHSIIHFNGHFHNVTAAERIFDSISDARKTTISITTMMDAYCKQEMYSRCIDLMMRLLKDEKWKHIDLVPICVAMALTAVINIDCFEVGQEIHDYLCNNNNLQWILSDPDVLTNLITMYGKNGNISVCKQLFEESGMRHVDVWNAMINAYGICGYLEDAVDLFDRMCRDEGDVRSNRYSYIMMLNAYGHHGQMRDCERIWKEIEDVAIKYDSHVMGSIVDGFARIGQLTKAMDLIIEYEMYHKKNDETGLRDSGHSKAMWISVLSSCRTYGNTMLGEHVAREALHRFPDQESAVLALHDKLHTDSISINP